MPEFTPHAKNACMSLSHGHIQIVWPLNLTVDDVNDITELFRITVNGMQRQAVKTQDEKLKLEERYDG